MILGAEFKKLYKNPSIIFQNLKNVYSECTKDELVNGKGWYESANSFSLYLSERYKVDEMKSAAIIAALSPQKEWELNKRIAEEFIDSGGKKSSHYQSQTDKARLILNSKLSHSEIESVLSGPKTVNFFNNIFNPESRIHVTVDRHHLSLSTRMNISGCTPKQYEFIKQNTIDFANDFGIIPSKLQSTLWLCWKRLKKHKYD
jgi:hypothetical protein